MNQQEQKDSSTDEFMNLSIRKSTLKHALFAILALIVVSILALLAIKTIKQDSALSTNIEIPRLLSEEQAISDAKKETLFHSISSGETLGTIMRAYGFSNQTTHKIVNAEGGSAFKSIRIGKVLEFTLDSETQNLEELKYPLSKLKTRAGINNNLIMNLSEIFGWDIDFVRDIRTNDSFKIVYEKYIDENNEFIQNGNIVSAEFINRGQVYTAIRYELEDGNIGYFAPDGSSMKGTFLKSPMRFSRISSGFSKRRFHPILKKWRSHKGVDYAARTGTAIRSVANGKVIFRGRKGGYGRTVVLSHGGKYTTLYAHMSKYSSKAKSGASVKQGQVIGYVGSSGLATGPHLHYEFRVNGVHRNPLTYKTPKATSVPKQELIDFSATAKEQLSLLNNISTHKNILAKN